MTNDDTRQCEACCDDYWPNYEALCDLLCDWVDEHAHCLNPFTSALWVVMAEVISEYPDAEARAIRMADGFVESVAALIADRKAAAEEIQ